MAVQNLPKPLYITLGAYRKEAAAHEIAKTTERRNEKRENANDPNVRAQVFQAARLFNKRRYKGEGTKRKPADEVINDEPDNLRD